MTIPTKCLRCGKEYELCDDMVITIEERGFPFGQNFSDFEHDKYLPASQLIVCRDCGKDIYNYIIKKEI